MSHKPKEIEVILPDDSIQVVGPESDSPKVGGSYVDGKLVSRTEDSGAQGPKG